MGAHGAWQFCTTCVKVYIPISSLSLFNHYKYAVLTQGAERVNDDDNNNNNNEYICLARSRKSSDALISC